VALLLSRYPDIPKKTRTEQKQETSLIIAIISPFCCGAAAVAEVI